MGNTFELAQRQALLLSGGPYEWHQGQTMAGYLYPDQTGYFKELDREAGSILKLLHEIMPPVPGKALVFQAPYSPRTMSWPEMDGLLVLSERVMSPEVLERSMAKQLTTLWWQDRETPGSSFLEVALRQFLEDYVSCRSRPDHYQAVLAERETMYAVYRANPGAHYQPNHELVRSNDQATNLIWLALELERRQGTAILAERVQWIFEISLDDGSFAGDLAVKQYAEQLVGEKLD